MQERPEKATMNPSSRGFPASFPQVCGVPELREGKEEK